MPYVLVAILSVVSCCVGFAVEITEGNIGHVQNGRTPNAGAALFPNIPFVPINYVLAAWALDRLHQGVGPVVVALYGAFSVAAQLVHFRKARLKLSALNATAADPGATT